jgi:hypothetical protein
MIPGRLTLLPGSLSLDSGNTLSSVCSFNPGDGHGFLVLLVSECLTPFAFPLTAHTCLRGPFNVVSS